MVGALRTVSTSSYNEGLRGPDSVHVQESSLTLNVYIVWKYTAPCRFQQRNFYTLQDEIIDI